MPPRLGARSVAPISSCACRFCRFRKMTSEMTRRAAATMTPRDRRIGACEVFIPFLLHVGILLFALDDEYSLFESLYQSSTPAEWRHSVHPPACSPVLTSGFSAKSQVCSPLSMGAQKPSQVCARTRLGERMRSGRPA